MFNALPKTASGKEHYVHALWTQSLNDSHKCVKVLWSHYKKKHFEDFTLYGVTFYAEDNTQNFPECY